MASVRHQVPRTPHIDTSVPRSARIYDYILAGKHGFEANREVGTRL